MSRRPIKLLFTADLHLGRILFGRTLLADQRHILMQLISLAKEQRISHMVIGGDLFDRAIPSAEAVALADWFFQECVTSLGLQVIVIAGNHDSPERLDFAAGLLARQGLHIIGSFPTSLNPINLGSPGQPIDLYALPYAEPIAVRHQLATDQALTEPMADLGDHQAAWQLIMQQLHQRWNCESPRPRLLVGHLFVNGSQESDSERPLSIGGAQAVAPTSFAGFDLVLLGHLHRCQEPWPGIWYAGSPLCYGAAEIDQEKSVLLVQFPQIVAEGKPRRAAPDAIPDLFGFPDAPPPIPPTIELNRLFLTPLRPTRRLRGRLVELLAKRSDDYVYVQLTDPLPIPDAFARLQQVYPWLLQVERLPPDSTGSLDPTSDTEHRRHALNSGDMALIQAFIQDMTGVPPPEEWQTIINETLDQQRLSSEPAATP